MSTFLVDKVSGIGSVSWSIPGNITTIGSPYTNATLNMGTQTHYLKATNYGFNIPIGATIDGIVVSINRKGSANTLGLGVQDKSIKLIKDGNVIGTDKANIGSTWGTTFNTINYGNSTDLWGTTWTVDEINSSNFGINLSVLTTAILQRTATVDFIKITVYYTPDTIAPDAFNVSPADGTVMQGASVTQSWGSNATDVHHYTYESYNDAVGTDLRWTEDFSITNKTALNVEEAEYWWRVKAIDLAGNIGEYSPLWKITIDNTAPEIIAPADETFEAVGPDNFYSLTQATATDNIDTNIVIDYSPKTFGLGDTEVTWTATDDAGNTSTTTSTVTIKDTTPPLLTLKGNNPFDLYINNDYEEPGFSAIDLVDGDITSNVEVTGEDFDNTVLGAHTITYTITDKNENSTSVTKIVNIVDRNKPIIYRQGTSPVSVEGGSVYEDAGATAIDRDGSDITSLIIKSGWDFNTMILGLFEIFYDVTGADLGDMTGTNIADQAKRLVNVVDTTGPKITVDPLTISIFVGDSYDVMTGVTCNDIIDGECKVSVESNLDTSKEGEYTIVYSAEDSTGNKAEEVTRTIKVITPDTNPPEIVKIDEAVYSIKAIDLNTIEVLFNEELQNEPGHHPDVEDFDAYNDADKSGNKSEGESSYSISSVSYANKKVTITLTDPIGAGDTPRLYITPALTSLVDLSGNYFNDGLAFDAKILDYIKPVITLNGYFTVEINEGDNYADLGATCADVIDSKCEVVSEGNVNTNIAGTYTISYNAKDEAGNSADEVTRTIKVNERSRQSTGSYLQGYGPRVLGAQTGGQVLGEEKFIFTQFMKFGTKGGEVPELQKFLNAKGYVCGPIDGIFGRITESCVKTFQKANPPLRIDGIVGSKTREVLNK